MLTIRTTRLQWGVIPAQKIFGQFSSLKVMIKHFDGRLVAAGIVDLQSKVKGQKLDVYLVTQTAEDTISNKGFFIGVHFLFKMTLPSFLLRGKKPHPGLNELIPQ